MDQGILPFVFEAATQPMDLTAFAGLTLVSETMLALCLDKVVQERLQLRERQRGYDEFDKLHSIVLLQAAGGDCVEDIRILSRDAGLVRLLGRPLPSPDALHDFLAAFHDESQYKDRPGIGTAWIPEENNALKALADINTLLVQRAVNQTSPDQATLDLDATIIESHKRDALPHYKGGRGYQPTAVVWAEQDLVVADQYRDGNVPPSMNTLAVARRAFDALPPTVGDRAFRGDSACHSDALLKHLVKEQTSFTISADMRPELRRVCESPSVKWTLLEDRVSETVRVADVEFTSGDWPKQAKPLRYVAIVFQPKQRTLFGDSAKYLAIVSNRKEELPAAEVVRWHWQKAGTIEYVHDVSKNDLAAGLLPSGKFGANAAWYRLTLLTYNILTVLRRHGLPERFRHARPKRLRYEVFTVPAEIHTHARQVKARLGVPPLTVDELVASRTKLRDLRSAICAADSSSDS